MSADSNYCDISVSSVDETKADIVILLLVLLSEIWKPMSFSVQTYRVGNKNVKYIIYPE